MFLLKYISDIELREQIGATTNNVEAYNGFSKWSFFGGEGVIAENDPEEQEKRIKYKDLVANIIIFQNVVDMTRVIRELQCEISGDDLAALSPYLTRHFLSLPSRTPISVILAAISFKLPSRPKNGQE